MNKISRIVRDVQPHWVGDGFPVRSLFSYHGSAAFDPFLLLDYGGPYEFAPAEKRRGVGKHPHRGFETVTIVYQGEVEHRDSSGSQGTIGPGDVQWMTAASGVVHEEMHSERFTQSGGMFEMVQLWVNLSAKDKMTPPQYQEILDAQIPRVPLPEDAGTVRVIAGEFLAIHGPARTFTPINVWDVQLRAGRATELQFPNGHTAIIVVQTGTLTVEDQSMQPAELALLEREAGSVRVRADNSASLLVLSGEPLNDPIVGEGPFVMNTRAQIREAIEDYRTGRMGRLS